MSTFPECRKSKSNGVDSAQELGGLRVFLEIICRFT